MTDVALRNAFLKGIAGLGLPLIKPAIHPGILRELDQFLGVFCYMTRAAYCPPEPNHPIGNIYVDYVHNVSINAAAFVSDGHEMIAINIGTILALWDSYLALLSNSQMMPRYGDSKGEKLSNDELASHLTREFSPGVDPRFLAHNPNDFLRVRMAQYFTWIGAMFIFCHEIGHHVKGHIEFLTAKTGGRTLYEYMTKDVPMELSTDVLKSLEFGADYVGARGSLIAWQEHLRSVHTPEDPWVLNNSLRVWVYAFASLFRILDVKPSGIKDYSWHSHPSPKVRLWQALFEVGMEVARESPDQAERYMSVVEEVTAEVDAVWDAMGLPAESFEEGSPHSPMNQVRTLNDLLIQLERSGLRDLERRRHVRVKMMLQERLRDNPKLIEDLERETGKRPDLEPHPEAPVS